jgi:acyl carrier protein
VRELFPPIPDPPGMTTKETHSLLRRYIKMINPRSPAGLSAESHFKYDWQLDSLDLVEFVARIEQKFKIMIPDEDLAQLVSLAATEQYIRSRLLR